MYSKFKIESLSYIKNLDEEKKEEYKEEYKNIFSKNKEKIKKGIEEFLLPDKSIDVEKLSNNWFKEVKVDIFISHSHRDEEETVILAGILNKEFGLKCFIDSMVWGNSLELLKEIDDRYNKLENGNYSYSGSTWAASNVHLILMIALKKMIDNTECVLFFKTPNSIEVRNMNKEENTASPWIFSEIEIINSIRIISPERSKIAISESVKTNDDKKKLNFLYKTDLKEYFDINDEIFKEWLNKKNQNSDKNSLDILYEIVINKNKERMKNNERR